MRAALSQNLFDLHALNNTRSAGAEVKASEFTYKNARELVVLVVGSTYLQVIANMARVEAAQAEVKTAQALYQQAGTPGSEGTAEQASAAGATSSGNPGDDNVIDAEYEVKE